MKLSECLPEKTVIFREGNFSSLGTFFSSNPRQMVYATKESDRKKISANPAIFCIITTASLAPTFPDHLGVAVVQDPRDAFYRLQSVLSKNPEFVLPAFSNRISPSAKIHPSAIIAPRNVEIGKDVVIEKNVIVHEHTIIDEGVVIRSNSIIGDSPGVFSDPGYRVEPSGGVHLRRETDIHANIIIHRAIIKGYTEIGEQTKIDNLSVVGAGTTIGKRCLICGGVTLGESAKIGNDVWIGPNVMFENQILIGNNVYITIGSVVARDIDDDKVVKDNYALDRKRFKKVIRGM